VSDDVGFKKVWNEIRNIFEEEIYEIRNHYFN